MTDIDIPVLKGLLCDTAAEISAVKRLLRAPWTRPMASEQRTLLALKLRATHLCILRAYLRGRYHLQQPMRCDATADGDWDRETHHREIAEQTAERYRLRRPRALAAAE